MKKRRILPMILSILLVFTLGFANLVSFPIVSAAANLTLEQLQSKFPHNKYWNHANNPGSSASANNQDGYTSTPCPQHSGTIGTSRQTCNGFAPSGSQLAWQCMGFAEKCGYDTSGYNPRNNANGWQTYTSSSALDNIKPGDIVRYRNNTHSIFITGVNGDTITYGDGNSDGKCIIKWNEKTSKATLKSTFSHLRSAPTALNTSVSPAPTTYTITYNANNGNGAPSSQTKTQGTALTLSSTIPTRTGYTFLGWATSNNAAVADYTAGGNFTTDANTTLYAVWKVVVPEKVLSNLKVTAPPAKTVYIEGTSFDKTGMIIKAVYDNGSEETLNASDYAVSPNPLTLGTKQVTITYLNKTAVQAVTVNAKSPVSIAITKNPTTTFKIGNTFNAAGQITVTYDNGSTKAVDITNSMVSSPNMSTAGTKQVTVTYSESGKTLTSNYNITVFEKELESISIKTQPSTKTFIEGKAFTTDGVITLNYDNGTTEDKPITEDMCSGYNMNNAGTQTVTITEEGKTTSYQINVTAKIVDSLVITTPPTKTVYIEDTNFDKAGMVVTAYYNNETSGIVTDYTVDKTVLALGDTSVTVTYGGKTDTTPIKVNAKVLTGITLKTDTVKKIYFEGEPFNVSGIIILAAYDNGITSEIPATISMISGYNKDLLEEQTITVTYAGKTAEFEVTVISKKAVKNLIANIDALDIDKLTIEDNDTIKLLQEEYDALSDFEKEAVANKDKLDDAVSKMNELFYPAVDDWFLDETVNIKASVGVIAHDVTLTVEKATLSSEVIEKIQAEYGDKSIGVFYDISLINSENNKIQPEGNLIIKIKLDNEYADGKDLEIVFVDSTGKVTLINGEIEDGFVSFETEHLSIYGIVKKIKSDDSSSSQTSSSSQSSSSSKVSSSSQSSSSSQISSSSQSSSSSQNNSNSQGSNSSSKNSTNPKTGDTGMSIEFISLILALFGIIIFTIYRKNKQAKV